MKKNEKYNFDNVHWYNMSLKQYVYFFYYCLELLDMFFGISINARCNSVWSICSIESVQDFFIKLDIKPYVKSCHRQTCWSYEQPPQTSQNLYFQGHFSVLKIGPTFPKKKYEEYLTRRPTFKKKCFWKFWFLRYFIS